MTLIHQEIYAKLTMYNFISTLATINIDNKDKKHMYKINYKIATKLSRKFLKNELTSKNFVSLIKYNLSPIRSDRSYERGNVSNFTFDFVYRLT